jgi:ArsR family transcriptional regulator, arsenate/arsenite/antimonite-responsive transcriptional repressor
MRDADPAPLPDACRDALERHLDPTIFKALGDPTRLTLLARLAVSSEPRTVTELCDCCGVHLSGVSRHLKILNDAALIRSQRQGREVRYRLDCAALTATLRGIADALDQCQATCCHQEQGDPQ